MQYHNLIHVYTEIGVLGDTLLSVDMCNNWHSLKTPTDCFMKLHEKTKHIGSKLIKSIVDVDYSWIVKIKPGENGSIHNHPTYPLVAVYYAAVTEKSGNLIFNTLNYSITPKNDMLVLFDGTLLHSIDYNRTDCDRISIGTHLRISEKKNV